MTKLHVAIQAVGYAVNVSAIVETNRLPISVGQDVYCMAQFKKALREHICATSHPFISFWRVVET
ncbi:hypothetical protein RY27_25720 [Litorilinea aerophila]|nr:hypothetical protein RY27_25720 [Litorilinea aerophila]